MIFLNVDKEDADSSTTLKKKASVGMYRVNADPCLL